MLATEDFPDDFRLLVSLALSAAFGILALIIIGLFNSPTGNVVVPDYWSAFSRVDDSYASFSIDLQNTGGDEAVVVGLEPIPGLVLADAWMGPRASEAFASQRTTADVTRLPARIAPGEQLDLVVLWQVADCRQLPITFNLDQGLRSFGADQQVTLNFQSGSESGTVDLSAQGPINMLARHLLDQGGCP